MAIVHYRNDHQNGALYVRFHSILVLHCTNEKR